MKILDENIIKIYKETSTTLTGSDRRIFQAKITNEYLAGNPNRAESVFGWGRNTVKLGLKELETGYICYVEIHVLAVWYPKCVVPIATPGVTRRVVNHIRPHWVELDIALTAQQVSFSLDEG